MAESATTRRMYEGELDHQEQGGMPRSLQEDYNASQADNPPELDSDLDIEYDQDQMAQAIQAYQRFESETFYDEELTANEEALDAFGQLFGEN